MWKKGEISADDDEEEDDEEEDEEDEEEEDEDEEDFDVEDVIEEVVDADEGVVEGSEIKEESLSIETDLK